MSTNFFVFQVYHYCHFDGRQDSFLCPRGTMFNQEVFVCDWWYNVNCESSEVFYSLNDNLYKVRKISTPFFYYFLWSVQQLLSMTVFQKMKTLLLFLILTWAYIYHLYFSEPIFHKLRTLCMLNVFTWYMCRCLFRHQK